MRTKRENAQIKEPIGVKAYKTLKTCTMRAKCAQRRTRYKNAQKHEKLNAPKIHTKHV